MHCMTLSGNLCCRTVPKPGNIPRFPEQPASDLLTCITPLAELPLQLTPAHQRTAAQRQQVQQKQAEASLKAAAAAKAVEAAPAAQQARAAEQRAAAELAEAQRLEHARQRQQQEGKERLAARAHKLKLLDQEQQQLAHLLQTAARSVLYRCYPTPPCLCRLMQPRAFWLVPPPGG